MYYEFKRKAISLRKKGYSYSMILESVPVSKSTLSYWLRDLPFKPNSRVKERMNDGLQQSVMLRHQVKLDSLKEARQLAQASVGDFSKRDLFMFGLGVYLGEGSKRDQQTKIINSDPRVLQFMVHWLMVIYNVPVENLRVMIHIYPDSDEATCIRYWSKVTGIPASQFQKTQVDHRTNKSRLKHRKLLYGTAHIRVKSNGRKDLGILLFRKIMSEIEVVFERLGIIISEHTH